LNLADYDIDPKRGFLPNPDPITNLPQGFKAWDELGIGNFLKASGFRDPQIKAAMVSVFNRLIEPCSEHELPDWVQTVSLEELLGGGINRYGDDRYYRVSDRLLELRIALERHLREREETLFNLKSSIVLYDLTNSYFEGECRRNPKAKRGHSKEKRSDCPLLSLGLIIDRAGFIIGHEVLEGNRHDCRTLVEMVACLESRLPDSPEKAVIVVDGGIATNENLKYLRENGYHYIVAAKRQSRNEFYEDFCDADSFSAVPGRESAFCYRYTIYGIGIKRRQIPPHMIRIINGHHGSVPFIICPLRERMHLRRILLVVVLVLILDGNFRRFGL
jgi:hypothetical protein